MSSSIVYSFIDSAVCIPVTDIDEKQTYLRRNYNLSPHKLTL